MAVKLNPVSKIIGLSSVLALGFLLVVLAAAIWSNWTPIFIAFIFAIAHLPTILTSSPYGYEDSLGGFDDSTRNETADAGKFLEAFLLVSAFSLTFVLHHCHIFTEQATALTLIGGMLIYGTVVTFTSFFDGFGDSDDPFAM